MSRRSSWRSFVACFVLAPFASSCSLLFVQPLKTNENAHQASPQCTSSGVAPTLDAMIVGWQAVRILLAAGASESDYQGKGLSKEGDIVLGVLFGALAFGSAVYGYNTVDECRRAGGGPDTRGTRKRNAQDRRDEEAAEQARAAALANMAAQQAQAAGVAAHKASAAAGPADAGTPP
jgi:hypothetical protein